MKENITLKITGMQCHKCSEKIYNEVKKLSVEELKVSYEEGSLSCRTDVIKEIICVIEGLGYRTELNVVEKEKYKGILMAVMLLLGLYLIIKNTIGFNRIPQLQNQGSYAILFVLGLITSLHCLSMCGGIVISQSVAYNNPIKSSILYNCGRVLAYTFVGGIVGALGTVMSFSPLLKGYITIFTGAFMMLLGLSMLQPFSFLKKYIKLPKGLNNIKILKHSKAPFFIGLATGLMPCGPLQTMQLYALGTGSPIKGALAMFIFSLGTVPLMMGFGTLSGYISSNLNRQLLKVSGILVMVLGLIIINRGLVLQGRSTLDKLLNPITVSTEAMMPEMINGYQVIRSSANDKGYEPNLFIVEKGRTVKWFIRGDEVNGCNNEIIIPTLNIAQTLLEGHNIIEFTPLEEGELGFSCWMGMLNGRFIIVDDLENIPKHINTTPPETTECCTRP
ncbi:urease accessory protein UreH domain-containing protein [Alkaliphilus transvaalensis]|uniref:urease accessory protein UreH domain-containing protein n=1 Tax=Alkaliphilus transvaalensis TaxID=114628 RepID=UPI0006842BA3|nr:sulfite exporter TauE/SafE family protein [Alkaliphilus transvaalensis]